MSLETTFKTIAELVMDKGKEAFTAYARLQAEGLAKPANDPLTMAKKQVTQVKSTGKQRSNVTAGPKDQAGGIVQAPSLARLVGYYESLTNTNTRSRSGIPQAQLPTQRRGRVRSAIGNA
jgi:hypothetical protein|tara:strand:+ start:506 stop:865 length:360 start_codon:yes stop_codon:yes gene_type:complete